MQENVTSLILNQKGVTILFNTLFFMLLMGFIYGYALSFLFKIKKIMIINAVAVFLTSILVLIYTLVTIYTSRCLNPYVYNGCFPISDESTFSTYFLLILGQFVVNIVVGLSGTLLGTLLSLPSMFLMRVLFDKSFQKEEPDNTNSHEPERFDSYKSSILYNKPTEVKPIAKTQSEFTKTSLFNKNPK